MKKFSLRRVLRGACVITLLVCVVMLTKIGFDYWKAAQLGHQAREIFLLPQELPQPSEPEKLAPEAPKAPEVPVPPLPPEVDFDALEAVNKDAIGWLWIGNTAISYPLLQGADNARYLDTAYDGSHSAAGSVFLDYRNEKDFSDANTVLYGHNMKDRSMFGSLKQYRQQTFADEHSEITIITRAGTRKYRVFAVYEIAADDTVAYMRNFDSAKAHANAVARAQKRSAISPSEPPASDTSFITLSTCTASDAYRLIVQAYFIE